MTSAVTSPGRRPRRTIGAALQLLAIIVLIVFLLLPIYWMIATSLKSANETFAVPPVFVFSPTLEHYQEILAAGAVTKSLINSLIVATATTVIALILGTPAAYAMARYDFRGKSSLWFWMISNRFISPIVVALPFFLLARNLKLLDTHLVLILTYLTFNIPLVVWLCIDQFRAIPRDVDQAALVDGASPWRAFASITLPLAVPGVVVSAIL
ncbi:MAG: carbohydrate ABC transporter permease, partial [Chloroflexota bacterium]